MSVNPIFVDEYPWKSKTQENSNSVSTPGCNADTPHLVHIVLGDQSPVRINLGGAEHKLTADEGWELLDLLDGMMSMLEVQVTACALMGEDKR